MATRRGSNNNYQGRGKSGGGKPQGGGNAQRVGVFAGWINPDEQKDEIFDALEGANFRFVLQEGITIMVDGEEFDGDLRLFRNDNDKGAGPHVNIVGYHKG